MTDPANEYGGAILIGMLALIGAAYAGYAIWTWVAASRADEEDGDA